MILRGGLQEKRLKYLFKKIRVIIINKSQGEILLQVISIQISE